MDGSVELNNLFFNPTLAGRFTGPWSLRQLIGGGTEEGATEDDDEGAFAAQLLNPDAAGATEDAEESDEGEETESPTFSGIFSEISEKLFPSGFRFRFLG